MAKTVPRDSSGAMIKPFHSISQYEHIIGTFIDDLLKTSDIIIVYDEGNVLDSDEASANNFAKLFNYHDARNRVRILDGGFIDFSKKYSFLRSTQMAHSPGQLVNMIRVSVSDTYRRAG